LLRLSAMISQSRFTRSILCLRLFGGQARSDTAAPLTRMSTRMARVLLGSLSLRTLACSAVLLKLCQRFYVIPGEEYLLLSKTKASPPRCEHLPPESGGSCEKALCRSPTVLFTKRSYSASSHQSYEIGKPKSNGLRNDTGLN
jgi:hypothetical protein